MGASFVALAARVILAVVLVVAAIAKLRARDATAAEMDALLGSRVGTRVARVLPFVEIAVAIALLVWWGPVPGIVAALLIVAFTVVLVRAEVRHLPCACFGGGARGVPGPGAVVRNAVLLALAVLATGTPR